MLKRMITALVTLMMLGAFLTGCEKAENIGSPTQETQIGTTSSPDNGTSHPSEETGEEMEEVTEEVTARPALSEIDKNITATLTITGTALNSGYIDEIIHQFNKEYPNVTIVKDAIQLIDSNVNNAAAELRTRLNVKLLSDQAGDIVMAGESTSHFNQNAFANLYDFMNSDPAFNRDDYFMNVIEAYSFNGGLYAMPLGNTVNMIGFYEPLAGSYNVTNTNDVWELTAVLDEGKKIADTNGLKGKNYVFSIDHHLFKTLFALNFAEFVDLESGKVNINSAEFIEMLNYVKELADNGYIPSSEHGGNSTDGSQVVMTVSTGRGAMAYWHMYSNVRPLAGKNGAVSVTGSSSMMAINNHSPNKQLAWEFIKLALSLEVQSSASMAAISPINKAALSVYAEQQYQLAMSLSQPENLNSIDEQEAIRDYEEMLVGLNDMVNKVTFIDYDIEDAVYEDAIKFFEGIVSAEETARNLQRKVSMMIEG